MQRSESQGKMDRNGPGASPRDDLTTGSTLETAAEVHFPIVSDTDILKVRSEGQRLGLSLGFSHGEIVSIVAAIVELARKIYQSESRGVITLITVHQPPSWGIIVLARGDGLSVPDDGPDLVRVLSLMDESNIIYDEHEGMTVAAKKMTSARPHHIDHNRSNGGGFLPPR